MGIKALDCDCGQHLESASEVGLVKQVTEHANEAHPDMNMDREQAEQFVRERGYDKEEAHDQNVDPRASSGA
jgi:predicted small metal-binding protein